MSVAAYAFGGKDAAKKTSLGYNLSGQGAAEAADDAAKVQAKSGREAIEYARETRDLARSDLSPFVNFATGAPNQPLFNRGIGGTIVGGSTGPGYDPNSPLGQLSSILTQQGQNDYLSNNPLFKMGLDRLDRASNNAYLGRGKVGSANNQIVQNAFLAGQPLLQQQTSNLFNAANLGQASAAGQANTAITQGNNIADLTTQIGNANAAGLVGGANARQQGAANGLSIFGSALAFSDRRLKRNITRDGEHGPYPVYTFQYLDDDQWYRGVMSDDVRKINPAAVSVHESGFDMINYGAL
jgi:hypothetical protein